MMPVPLIVDGKNGKPMIPQARIMIAVPCMDQVQAMFAYSLANMMTHTALTLVGPTQPIGWLRLMFHSGTLIAPQRRDLAATALAIDATHILWIDSDTVFPKDSLNRLLARNKDYVGVNQSGRRPPCGTTAFRYRTPNDPPEMVYTYPHSTGLEEVHAMGFGLTLCRTDIFRTVAEPWFPMQWGHLPNGEWGFRGEDCGFQEWARKAGYQLWIDHDLSQEIGHIGTFSYTHAHALIQRDAMKEEGKYIIPEEPTVPEPTSPATLTLVTED